MVIRTTDIVVEFLKSYLHQNNLEWRPSRREAKEIAKLTGEEIQELNQICQILREISNELFEFIQEAHAERFRGLAERLLENFNYEAFKTMMEELFVKEISWNYIITFLLYGGELACRAILWENPSREINNQNAKRISQIIDWMSTYINENLLQWITEQGGWMTVRKLQTKNTNNFKGMRHYFGMAAFAFFVGGLYLRSKLSVQ